VVIEAVGALTQMLSEQLLRTMGWDLILYEMCVLLISISLVFHGKIDYKLRWSETFLCVALTRGKTFNEE